VPLPVIPPAGTSPAGFFVPVNYRVPGEPIAMLADPLDPVTLEYLSIERGFDPVDAAVVTAVRTKRESGSAVEDVGQRYQDHPRVDEHLEQFMREETRIALEHLTDAGEIAFKLSVQNEGDTSNLYLEFENLVRQRQALGVAIPLNKLIGVPG
jgi:hypothetical protein